MDTKETKKSGIEKEPPRKEAGAETEGKEGLKELLSKQGEAVDSSVENLKAGGEKDIEAVKKVGGREDVEEIRDGVEKIGQEAEGAKDIYEKEAIEAKRGLKTEKEIMEEVGKINEKIDEAIRKGLREEEEKLRQERERLFGLLDLDNKYGSTGAKAGYIHGEPEQETKGAAGVAGSAKESVKEEGREPSAKEEIPAKIRDKSLETGVINEKASEEIKKILKDPTSELSILVKAANFEEDYIPELEKDLEKAKASRIDRESNIKFYEKSIAEHKATLRNHTKKIKEITNKIEEEIKKGN